METMNVALPAPMKEYVQQRVADGEYGSVSEYVRELIRKEQTQHQRRKLESLLLDGLESGTPVDLDDARWEEIMQNAKLPRSRRRK